MTEQSSQQKSVGQDVSKEIGSLKTEIRGLSEDIQKRINAAGDEAKKTWGNLQQERKRFFDRVEQAAEETKADLRQAGSDLKRRLSELREELKAEPGQKQSGGGQTGKSSS
jgi:acyl-CoA reductase-like NAD-dependent aldehyde dehydrogenase